MVPTDKEDNLLEPGDTVRLARGRYTKYTGKIAEIKPLEGNAWLVVLESGKSWQSGSVVRVKV